MILFKRCPRCGGDVDAAAHDDARCVQCAHRPAVAFPGPVVVEPAHAAAPGRASRTAARTSVRVAAPTRRSAWRSFALATTPASAAGRAATSSVPAPGPSARPDATRSDGRGTLAPLYNLGLQSEGAHAPSYHTQCHPEAAAEGSGGVGHPGWSATGPSPAGFFTPFRTTWWGSLSPCYQV